MKAKEAFEISVYKRSLNQIEFISEKIRNSANNGLLRAQISFEPTEQTKNHFEKLGYSIEFPNESNANDPYFFVSFDLTKTTDENTK